MALEYTPGSSLAHRLDPRSKLAVQLAMVALAFAYTTPIGLLAVTGVTAVVLGGAGTSPVAALRELRLVLPFLVAGPLLTALTWQPPYVSGAQALPVALAAYRSLLLLFVAAALIRTTPVRETRAAFEWLVPGRPGRLLGMGVAIAVRFLPVLQRDLRQIRAAGRARLATQRSLTERIRLIATTGLGRALGRADRFGDALRARCLAWNPTPPALRFGPADWVATAVAVLGGLVALAPTLGL